MDALEQSAIVRGAARSARSASKARHPRSRGERALLDELHASIGAVLALAESRGPSDELLAEAQAAAAARPLAAVSDERAALASNDPHRPRLFYAPAPVSGDLLPPPPRRRRDPSADCPRATRRKSFDAAVKLAPVADLVRVRQ